MKSLINSLLGRGSSTSGSGEKTASDKPAWLPEHGSVDPNNFLSFSMPVFWGTRDPERVNQLVAELLPLLVGGYHSGDNLLTWVRNISFLDDPAFRKAYESNIQNPADSAIAWRRYIIACAGYHCVQLEGDFVECGVYRATGIKTVVDYLGGKAFPKQFYGYDTFDYNPVEGHAFEGQQAGFSRRCRNVSRVTPRCVSSAGSYRMRSRLPAPKGLPIFTSISTMRRRKLRPWKPCSIASCRAASSCSTTTSGPAFTVPKK